MRNVSRAAAACAAFAALAASAVPAAAQDGTVVIEGLVWFDRNGNGTREAGEPPLANGRAIRVSDVATKQDIGAFGTDAEGRYRAVVPDVPVMVYNHNADVFQPTTKHLSRPVVGGGTFDFGLRGADVPVLCWVEDDNPTDSSGTTPPGGCPVRLTGGPFGVDLPIGQPTANGTYFFNDLPAGKYAVTAGTLFEHGLALTRPDHENDVDWATYRREIEIDHSLSGPWVEVTYDEARGDMAYVLRLEPNRDRFEVGEEFEAVVSVTNRGTAPERAAFVLGEPFDQQAEKLSVGDNVTAEAGEYTLKDRLLPGETAEVRFKLRVKAPFSMVDVVGAHVNELPDADPSNNAARVPVTIGGGTSTTPPTTSTTPPTTTTAPTTGSSTIPVAGDGGDLAETGAAPFPLFALGGLLLGGGALALVAARRRRRA